MTNGDLGFFFWIFKEHILHENKNHSFGQIYKIKVVETFTLLQFCSISIFCLTYINIF